MVAGEKGKPFTALGDPPPKTPAYRMGRRDPARRDQQGRARLFAIADKCTCRTDDKIHGESSCSLQSTSFRNRGRTNSIDCRTYNQNTARLNQVNAVERTASS